MSGYFSIQDMVMNAQIQIGEVSISIEGDDQIPGWEIPPAYQPFIQPGTGDIGLHLQRGIPDNRAGKKVFESPPIWTLYRNNGRSLIRIFKGFPGLRRTLVYPHDLESADLYFPEERGQFHDPFYGPTMELLMVNYLAAGRGAITHALGVAEEGRGLLFVGESGAGKSTLARLWDAADTEVLSDDRIIVRKKEGTFWMYGTPWHGEAALASPRGVQLAGVFFLRHGRTNAAEPTIGIDAVSRLITCAFLPHWDAESMAYTLELFTDLAARVPCFVLTFKPERAALDVVRHIPA